MRAQGSRPKARPRSSGGSTTTLTVGAIVVVSLANPREKYWGRLLDLSAAGVSVHAISLGSLDDFVTQVRGGEQVSPATLFFPMHRVERMELDARNGPVESLAHNFEIKSGKRLDEVFGRTGARG